MTDWPEVRLQWQLWLHQSWLFRVIAWLRLLTIWRQKQNRPVPTLTLGQITVHGGITAHQTAFSLNAATARASIADAERTENSMSTRIDAAIHAISLLDPTALFDTDVKQYLHLKYYRVLTDDELTFYWRLTLGMARELLSKLETK